MNRMFKGLLLFFTFIIVVQVNGKANNERLTLEDCDTVFIRHNLSLLIEKFQIEKSQADLVQARLFENPTLSFEQNIYNGYTKRYFDMGSKGEYAVEVEQLIHLAGQRNKRIQLEKINGRMAAFQFEELVRTLVNELHTTFIEIGYAQKITMTFGEEILSLQRLLENLNEQVEKKNISRLEMIRIESLLNALKKEQTDRENNLIELKGKMRILLGQEIPERAVFYLDEEVLCKLDIDSLSEAQLLDALSDRPDLKMAGAQVSASHADIRFQKAEAVPDVSLSFSYDKAGNFMNDYFAVGLSVPLPLFNRNQGNIRKARIGLLQSRIQEQSVSEQARSELGIAYRKLLRNSDLYHSVDRSIYSDYNRLTVEMIRNFEKRNISLLEFVDYFNSSRENYLLLCEISKDYLLSIENLNSAVGKTIIKR